MSAYRFSGASSFASTFVPNFMRKVAAQHRLAASLFALYVALGSIAPAIANDAPSQIQTEVPQARLAGEGAFRWFGLKIYDAQLWVGRDGYRPQTSVATFALDLRYARSLQGKKIAEASDEQFAKLNLGTTQQRAIWKAGMMQIFPDVQDGSHLTGIYLPNQGARFYLDGKPIGDIMDADFAQAFFAIWLSPNTTAPQLRDALLKNAEPR
jgi:hypothetical protein